MNRGNAIPLPGQDWGRAWKGRRRCTFKQDLGMFRRLRTSHVQHLSLSKNFHVIMLLIWFLQLPCEVYRAGMMEQKQEVSIILIANSIKYLSCVPNILSTLLNQILILTADLRGRWSTFNYLYFKEEASTPCTEQLDGITRIKPGFSDTRPLALYHCVNHLYHSHMTQRRSRSDLLRACWSNNRWRWVRFWS